MRRFRVAVVLAAALAVVGSASAQRASANAADLQALTALTLAIKGSVTVNYAFTAYGYGLTDYATAPPKIALRLRDLLHLVPGESMS